MCAPDPPHRKQCKRHDIPGHAHYLTFSCFGRQPFLASDRARRWLLDAIRAAREEHPFDLWAFVIMPDQEAALRTPQYQDAYATAIVHGLETYFASLAQQQP